MLKDRDLKMKLLEQIMGDMKGREVERDLKPKSKMVVSAKGDNPEEMKENVIDKLEGMELPDEKEMEKMSEMVGDKKEEEPEESLEEGMEEGEEEYADEEELSALDKLKEQGMEDLEGESDEEEDEDFLGEMPESLKKAILKMKKKKKEEY